MDKKRVSGEEVGRMRDKTKRKILCLKASVHMTQSKHLRPTLNEVNNNSKR
ncbi:hypothetical protein BaRGS_00002107, partial [Batillaria attramentaria]